MHKRTLIQYVDSAVTVTFVDSRGISHEIAVPRGWATGPVALRDELDRMACEKAGRHKVVIFTPRDDETHLDPWWSSDGHVTSGSW